MSKHTGGGWDDEGNRRVAVLWVDELNLFDGAVSWLTDDPSPATRLRLIMEGLNLRDCKVVRVTHDVMRRAFGFLLYHPSFAAVPDGCHAPDLSTTTKWEWVPPLGNPTLPKNNAGPDGSGPHIVEVK